jgi:hypothetical protein
MKVRLLLAFAPILLAALAPQERQQRLYSLQKTVSGDQFIFFAVLEGLFADAVPDEIVDKILEKNDQGGFANFVYACGICSPSIEGFRAYLARHQYSYARKGDMIGDPKLPEDLSKLLRDGSAEARRAGIHKLINRYLQRRVDQLRMTEEERTAWAAELAERRKKGMEMLKTWKLPWKECPSCEGACDAFKK